MWFIATDYLQWMQNKLCQIFTTQLTWSEEFIFYIIAKSTENFGKKHNVTSEIDVVNCEFCLFYGK